MRAVGARNFDELSSAPVIFSLYTSSRAVEQALFLRFRHSKR